MCAPLTRIEKLEISLRSPVASRTTIARRNEPAISPARLHAVRHGFATVMLCLLAVFSPPSLVIAASSVELAWNSNPETDISGYRISYGTKIGSYPNAVRVGNTPSATISGLNEGTTYYFVVAAINSVGLQGPDSDVVSYFNPIVPPSNRVPVALANSLTVNEDTQLNVILTGTDADGDFLSYTVENPPARGTLSGTPPNLTYTPAADVSGTDSFSFRAFDGALYSAVETISISITAVNDAPVANSKSLKVNNNGSFPIVLSGSDKDSFTLTYAVTANPASGKLSGIPPNLVYTPASNFVGSDQFMFRVSDGTLSSASATIAITVSQTATTPEVPVQPQLPANLPPVFVGNPITFPDAGEGVPYAGHTLAGMATDSGPITYWKISGPGWLNVAPDGSLSGTPPLGSTGLNAFIVRAADSSWLVADSELRIRVDWLPVPWQSANVGIGQQPGSVTYNAGVFTQMGSGALGGNRDNFRFTYQMLSANGEISAKVSSMLGYGTWVRAGVMIRDSLAQNSRHVFFGLTNATSYRVLSRTKGGARTTIKSNATFSGADTWVRLVRSGSRIISYKSANGINWTYVATTKVNLNRDCYIGLVVASGGNAANFTAQFSNVNVVP